VAAHQDASRISARTGRVPTRLQSARVDHLDQPELSVVIPVYGCAACLEDLTVRLERALGSITTKWEIVYVDDRSTDGAWPKLRELSTKHKAVKAYRLSRNFGQHAAITAGLAHSSGRWTVVMDCDLQEPPELIPRLYARAQQGFDIVLAKRIQRRQSLYRRLSSSIYFRLMTLFLGFESTGEYGTFSIVSRKVVDAFLNLKDMDRHYLLILFWLGFARDSIAFEHHARETGKSAYSLRRLIQVSVDGLFFQTTTLLKFIVYMGFALAAAGVLLAVYLIAIYLSLHPYPYPGWTSLAVLILTTGGFIVISTGVTGLYIGKIFQQVKDRPLYVIDETAASEDAFSARSSGRLGGFAAAGVAPDGD
jgi:glycosyltransferase involved in cell wall biosynthesis